MSHETRFQPAVALAFACAVVSCGGARRGQGTAARDRPVPVQQEAVDTSNAEQSTAASIEESDVDDTVEAATATSVDRHGTPLSTVCVQALDVVSYLADRCGNNHVFSAKNCKPWDVERIIVGLSPVGLVFRDVNVGGEKRYPRAEVERQLRARSGSAFVSIAHLGYTYWRPKDSPASCRTDETRTFVRIGRWYELAFDPKLLLTTIDYEMIEGH